MNKEQATVPCTSLRKCKWPVYTATKQEWPCRRAAVCGLFGKGGCCLVSGVAKKSAKCPSEMRKQKAPFLVFLAERGALRGPCRLRGVCYSSAAYISVTRRRSEVRGLSGVYHRESGVYELRVFRVYPAFIGGSSRGFIKVWLYSENPATQQALKKRGGTESPTAGATMLNQHSK